MKLVPFLLLVLLVVQAVPLAIADHDDNTDPLPIYMSGNNGLNLSSGTGLIRQTVDTT